MTHYEQIIKKELNGKEITLITKTNQDGSGELDYTVNGKIVYQLEFDYLIDNIDVNLLGGVDDFDCLVTTLFYYDSEGNSSLNIPKNVIEDLEELIADTLQGYVEAPEDEHQEWI